jgi:hypothetical protein
MLDITPGTYPITRSISTGTIEQALLAAVAHLFANLVPTELSQALQLATAAAAPAPSAALGDRPC